LHPNSAAAYRGEHFARSAARRVAARKLEGETKMRLKKLKDSQGRECYGVSCEDVERHSKAFDEDDLQKRAPHRMRLAGGVGLTVRKSDGSTELLNLTPAISIESAEAVSSESLTDLRKSINKQLDELTKIVGDLVKKRMTESAAAKRFQPLAHGEVLKHSVGDIPARQDLGHNPARNANILKSEDGFTREVLPRDKNSFAPIGVRKHDAEQAETIELIKDARKNAKPPFAYR
jgi:hypothetical protein